MHYLFFERYQRLLENAFIALQSRVNSALTATAEEKYIKLTNGTLIL
jgi:hypothetical protein